MASQDAVQSQQEAGSSGEASPEHQEGQRRLDDLARGSAAGRKEPKPQFTCGSQGSTGDVNGGKAQPSPTLPPATKDPARRDPPKKDK